MITLDLREAIARAAAGQRSIPDPKLRPAGGPGRYATSIAFGIAATSAGTRRGSPGPPAGARDIALALAERLGAEPFIETATVTGDGFVTITVTRQALAQVAARVITAGPACTRSGILNGVTVPAPPAADWARALTWEQARATLAAQLTARLAVRAGATPHPILSPERALAPPPAQPSHASAGQADARAPGKPAGAPMEGGVAWEGSGTEAGLVGRGGGGGVVRGGVVGSGAGRGGSSGGAGGDEAAGAPVGGEAAQEGSGTEAGLASAREDARDPVQRAMAGTSAGPGGSPERAGPEAASRIAVAAGVPEVRVGGGGAGGGRRRSGGEASNGPVGEAIGYAGADAVRFVLARAVPGRPVAIDAASVARQVPGNPAYAVRYAHARAVSGLRWAAPLGDTGEAVQPCPPADPAGWVLLDALSWLPERVATAARRGRPDEFARYLEDLASATITALPFPGNGHATAPGDNERLALTHALAAAARTGLAAGLDLLGVSAPQSL